jgi:hypothetical protein
VADHARRGTDLGLEPDHEIAQGVTVGGLERLRESGDLEDPPDGIDDSRLRDLATVKAGLKFSDAILHGCERLPTSGPVELRPGQLLRALSDQRITLFRGGVATTASVTWRVESDAHDAIEVQVPLEVHIEPVDGDAAQLCAAAPAPRSP